MSDVNEPLEQTQLPQDAPEVATDREQAPQSAPAHAVPQTMAAPEADAEPELEVATKAQPTHAAQELEEPVEDPLEAELMAEVRLAAAAAAAATEPEPVVEVESVVEAALTEGVEPAKEPTTEPLSAPETHTDATAEPEPKPDSKPESQDKALPELELELDLDREPEPVPETETSELEPTLESVSDEGPTPAEQEDDSTLPEPIPEPLPEPAPLSKLEPELAELVAELPEPLPEPLPELLLEPEPQATQTPQSSKVTNAPGRGEMPVDNRPDAQTSTGSTDHLSWGARSDVGLVRGHNEDSFLAKAPLFAVCDGMGGHAAGEVASRIAVDTIAERAPEHADEILLGAAVEAANEAVLEGSLTGKGKPGMGCTATCVLIENNLMAVAHVGDSRVYLLHEGTLVRITHDHSYVEELVDAGEITADEARVHPSRSIITRALGSDPDMYADHFTLDVSTGDRVIVCSDGLSSMVPDKQIEELAVSNVTPQAAADTLVSAALTAGGHDNVTVVVVDVVEDGLGALHRAERRKSIFIWLGIAALAIVAILAAVVGLAKNSWYVGNNDGTVGVFRGVNDEFFGMQLYQLTESSSVKVSDLPVAIQQQLEDGIGVASEAEACATVERYRDQINAEKTRAAQAAEAAKGSAGANQKGEEPAEPKVESGDSTPPEAAATGQQAANQAAQNAHAEAQSGTVAGEGE